MFTKCTLSQENWLILNEILIIGSPSDKNSKTQLAFMTFEVFGKLLITDRPDKVNLISFCLLCPTTCRLLAQRYFPFRVYQTISFCHFSR